MGRSERPRGLMVTKIDAKLLLKCSSPRIQLCPELRTRLDDLLGPGNIKLIAATAWVLTVCAITLVLGLSGVSLVAAAALALLPPLALLLLWHDPTPTLSESINKARR